MNRRGLMSVVEMGLLFVLFISVFSYISINDQTEFSPQYRVLDSYLSAALKDTEFREAIMREDLTSSTPDSTSSVLNDSLNSSFRSYALRITNATDEKWLWRCDADFQRIFVERLVFIENLTHYEPRIVRLGVCT